MTDQVSAEAEKAARRCWEAAVPDLLDGIAREPSACGLLARALFALRQRFDASLFIGKLIDSLRSDLDSGQWATALQFEPALAETIVSLGDALPAEYRKQHPQERIRARIAVLDSAMLDASTQTGVPGHVRALVRSRRTHAYAVVDLVVATIARDLRTPEQGADLYLAFNAAPTVDRALTAIDRRLRLAHEPGPHVVRHLLPCAEPMVVGDASGNDGRSLELAALLAALSRRCGWRWRHDRVVATGSLLVRDDAIEVTGVGDLAEKLKAVLAWVESLGPGAADAVVIVPSDLGYVASGVQRRVHDISTAIAKIEALGPKVHRVSSLRDLFATGVLPWAEAFNGASPALGPALVAWTWYAERIIGGEWMADPATRAHHGILTGLLVSMLPAVLPAAGAWLALRHALATQPHMRRAAGEGVGRWRESSSAKRRLFVWLVPLLGLPSWIMFLVVWSVVDFPADTPYLPHPDPAFRTFFVFKDIGGFYPLILAVLIGLFIRERALRLAPAGLRAGRLFDANWTTVMDMASFPGKTYVIPSLMLLTVAGFFLNASWFMPDFRWAIEHGNTALFLHIGFQIALPTVTSLLLASYLHAGPRD